MTDNKEIAKSPVPAMAATCPPKEPPKAEVRPEPKHATMKEEQKRSPKGKKEPGKNPKAEARLKVEETLRQTKLEKSAPFFRNTRVLTCSKVVVKGGEAVAVAFPQKKTGYKAPGSYGNMSKSSETKSLARYSRLSVRNQ